MTITGGFLTGQIAVRDVSELWLTGYRSTALDYVQAQAIADKAPLRGQGPDLAPFSIWLPAEQVAAVVFGTWR